MAGAVCADNPDAKGVVLESHGLFTWDDDAKGCHDLTVATIQKAMDWFADQTSGKAVFGSAVGPVLGPEDRRAVAAQSMPVIRGLI